MIWRTVQVAGPRSTMSRLRKKLPALREALEGRFSDKHALIVGQIIAHIDFLDEAIDRLSEAVEEQLGPFGNQQVRHSVHK